MSKSLLLEIATFKTTIQGTYLAAKKAVEDNCGKAFIFSNITSLLQPYLTKYQTHKPVLWFLENDLERLHQVLILWLKNLTDVLDK